jgi:hypothetical protein
VPSATDSDQNRSADQNIVFTQNVECPECETIFDAYFDTGAKDEDGLTDLEDLEAEVTCVNPDCTHVWTEQYTAWTNYGDA